jgi:hypothetical protein
MKMGVNMRPMHVANMAKAASSSPPNTSKRSQRLTADIGQPSILRKWCVPGRMHQRLKRYTQELAHVTRRRVAVSRT